MNERIKELAEQAGAELYADTIIVNGKDADDFVKRFAELVAAAEREACAELCEKVANDYTYDRNEDGYDWPDGHACAEAIRAKK